jgi:hypothetical protein
MNIQARRSTSAVIVAARSRRSVHSFGSSSRGAGRRMVLVRRRRERVLACLAFIMLIVAWDATLRLDEHVAPPRMRLSHAVEHEHEVQTQTFVP